MPCADGRWPSCTSDDIELDNTTTCKFKFSVYWDIIHEQWMLPHYQRGCIKYCGHPKIKPEHLRVRTAVMLDENNVEVVNDSFSSKICASSTQNLMETRTGHTLSYDQLLYLGRKQKKEESRQQGLSCDVVALL